MNAVNIWDSSDLDRFSTLIGPTLSGYLVEYFNWRSLFHVVAIAAITFIIALFTVKNVGQNIKVPIDVISIILSILDSVVYFMVRAPFHMMVGTIQ